MKNKTARECWDILRGELDTAIDSYVPMKKQGKRSKKKHLSKEAFRKMRYKQNMWRVYKHTGKDKHYEVYKEALNAATNEVRKAKRNFEHKLAQNIKSDSKSFYAYVRSKQNVRDKVGPLEDNAGNIITEGCLMAEELNVHFSSVFTREDTSSLPVPETKFNGSEEERLGQLVVTPEVVASKINNMKENKSPGVDGLSPKILKETVEQISKPLAHVFNMSLQEGIVPVEWKEANIIPLFKKGSRNKSVNYRPVSLTSVICKLPVCACVFQLPRLRGNAGTQGSTCGRLKGNQVLGMIRRNKTYKEKSLIVPLYKAIVRPHLEYCIQAWSPYLRKDIAMLEKIQRRATKLIPGLGDIRYEERLKECGLTTLETRRLRGDQIEVFKILNGYENIDSNVFFSKLRKVK